MIRSIILLIYFIFINNPFGFIAAINRYSINVQLPEMVQSPECKWATVLLNNKIQIAWMKQENINISFYNIYRASIDLENDFKLIGTISYNDEPLFNDYSSYPYSQWYKYRISAVNKCGDEIFSNNIFKSIRLQLLENVNGFNELVWNAYEGKTVKNYIICRGDSFDNMLIIDSVSFNTTNYVDSKNGAYFYQVVAVGNNSDIDLDKTYSDFLVNEKSEYVLSKSNIIFNHNDTILNPFIEDNLLVTPNPILNEAEVSFPFDKNQTYQLNIYDLYGNNDFKCEIINSPTLIKIGNLKCGMYILEIAGNRRIAKKIIVVDSIR